MNVWVGKYIHRLGTKYLYFWLVLCLCLISLWWYHLGTASWRPKRVGAMVGSTTPLLKIPGTIFSIYPPPANVLQFLSFFTTCQWCIFKEWVLHPDWHTISLWNRKKTTHVYIYFFSRLLVWILGVKFFGMYPFSLDWKTFGICVYFKQEFFKMFRNRDLKVAEKSGDRWKQKISQTSSRKMFQLWKLLFCENPNVLCIDI